MIKPICEFQTQTEVVCFENDDGVDVVRLEGDDSDSGIEADREVVPWFKKGESNMVNLESTTLFAMDTIPPMDGLLSVEQETGHVLVEGSASTVLKEHEMTCSTTMAENTYKRRHSKSLKEKEIWT